MVKVSTDDEAGASDQVLEGGLFSWYCIVSNGTMDINLAHYFNAV